MAEREKGNLPAARAKARIIGYAQSVGLLLHGSDNGVFDLAISSGLDGDHLQPEAAHRGLRLLDVIPPIGIVFVAAMAARTATSGAPALMTATLRLMRSAAMAGSRSNSPSAQRYSIVTLRPSAKPASPRPRWNPAMRFVHCTADTPCSTPMTGIPACCARAASGHAAAAPPSSVMNSRRFIRSPRRRRQAASAAPPGRAPARWAG